MEWRDIKEFEGQYQISNSNPVQIKSCEREVPHWQGGTRVLKEKMLKQYKDKRTGHLKVTFQKDGKAISKYVHRLFAEAFIPNPEKFKMVHFKKGNEISIENLEWISHEKDWWSGSKKIAIYESDSETAIRKFKNIEECANELDVDKFQIRQALNSNHKCKGYIFKLV